MTPAAAELAVLMALRVQGRAGAQAVAAATGLDHADVRVRLDAVCARGLALPTETRDAVPFPAYRLTPTGRVELARLLAGEAYDRVALASLYEDFLVTDAALKATVTDWQLATVAERDRALAPLTAAAARAIELSTRIGRIAPRLVPYARRLATARAAIVAGDARFVAGPTVESLHRIWFELHEDLLATLGCTRTT